MQALGIYIVELQCTPERGRIGKEGKGQTRGYAKNRRKKLSASPQHEFVVPLPVSVGLSKAALLSSPVRVEEGREHREKGQEEAHDRVEHPLLHDRQGDEEKTKKFPHEREEGAERASTATMERESESQVGP